MKALGTLNTVDDHDITLFINEKKNKYMYVLVVYTWCVIQRHTST